jgi:hypothetical protein
VNYPKLNLPDGAETLAFRAVERVLATDPLLSSAVRTLVAWRGEAADLLEPAFATCPFVKLSPAPAASAWETEGLHRAPLVVAIDLAVAGTDVDQLLNLWAAVRLALWPPDPARAAVVRPIYDDARIVRPVLTLAGYGTRLDEKSGAPMLAAAASLQLILHVDTP